MRGPIAAAAACAAGCQIFPAYYPAEVAPFVAGGDGDHSAAAPSGDTGEPTNDTGLVTTTPGGAVVVHFPTGAPPGPLPCADGDPYTRAYLTFVNPGGWAYDVVARAADCSEAVVYSSAELEVLTTLPAGGAYVVRAAGSTWVSMELPPAVVYLTVEIP